MMAPNIEKPMMNPTPEAALKVRFLNKAERDQRLDGLRLHHTEGDEQGHARPRRDR